jgi:multidrug resistance efflux pump
LTLARLTRPLAPVAVLLSVVVFAACGESAEDKAKAQVCDARSDISKQISTLTTLTLSASVVSEVKTGVQAIGNDLKKIKDAQPDLQPARKQQVEKATEEFQRQVSSTVSGITSGLSLTNAETQLKTALTQLGQSYRQTLAPINCS